MASSLILILQILCLALWIGGSFVVLVAVHPVLSSRGSNEGDGSFVEARILQRFRVLQMTALVLLGITIWAQLILLGPALALKLRLVLILVTAAILVQTFERFAVAGKRAQSGGAGSQEPGTINRRSTRLLSLNLFIGITVVITLIIR
jgi:uncharacterized membrane protein